MLIDLGSEESLDPGTSGSKAAWLAAAHRAGVPVLPGLVVPAAASRRHMAKGAATLPRRGSGGARLAIMADPLPFAPELVERGAELGPVLVARSSTPLEAGGEWAGAFASYLDLAPDELPKAVTGCWASAFSVDSLERQRHSGVAPGSFPMAVLVQGALRPKAGGTASIDADGVVTVRAVPGSPAPLLQGWAAAATARWDGSWEGEEMTDLLELEHLADLLSSLRAVHSVLGANQVEWALDGRAWVLQVGFRAESRPAAPSPTRLAPDPLLVRLAAVLVEAPGPLGEELVLPWAVAGLPSRGDAPAGRVVPVDRLRVAAEELTGGVWDMPSGRAIAAARATLAALRGPDPGPALEVVGALRPAPPGAAARLLADLDATVAALAGKAGVDHPHRLWHLDSHRLEEIAAGRAAPERRVGLGRWEPFLAAVAFACGEETRGVAASPGIGAGPVWRLPDPVSAHPTPPRQVVVTSQAVPQAAPLAWEASALVTGTGSPSAHLFDSARSLGVPAVCGVEVSAEGHLVVGVDGYSGTVSIVSLEGGAHV